MHEGAATLFFTPFSFPFASVTGCGLAGSRTDRSPLQWHRRQASGDFLSPLSSDSVQNYSAVSTSSSSVKVRDRSNDCSSLFGGRLWGTRYAILKSNGLKEQCRGQRCRGEIPNDTRLGFRPQNHLPQAPVSLQRLL